MTTARTIITRAMKKVGILTRTEQPAADEANDALDSMNMILASWSNEATLISARTVESFPLIAGQLSYTIGTGGNFNTVKPTEIISAYVRDASGVDLPVTQITDDAYAQILLKTTQGQPYWFKFSNAYPLADFRLYPSPDTGYTLFLVSEKPFVALTLDTVLTFPPGWERALVYNLAIELAGEYSQEASQSVIAIAAVSLRLVQKAINRVRTMDAYPINPQVPNIYSGWNN